MNQMSARPATSLPLHASLETLTARFALRVAARLTERTSEIDPDLTERLRFAREKALARAREVRLAQAPAVLGVTRGGAAVLGAPGGRWWFKLAAVLPAFALAVGLVLIQRAQDASQLSVAAEVDAALLSDDLPPQAYRDAGFAEFLKTPTE
jgi:Protein of unknown function (DUF3619)